MISNISGKEHKEIKKSLPHLEKLIDQDESFLKSGYYQKIFISVFDHWLTHQEADTLIFIDKDKTELDSRRKKFKDFIENLSNQTDLYTWKYKKHYSLHVQKPNDISSILRKCDFENLWSQSGRRYSFLIPEFCAVYEEEWDWTNIIWYKKDKKIEPVLDIAKKSGLHILK